MVKPCHYCACQAITFPVVPGGIAATCPDCGAYGPTSAVDGIDALAQWNGGYPSSVDMNSPANATKP